jgi:hypothetical protein
VELLEAAYCDFRISTDYWRETNRGQKKRESAASQEPQAAATGTEENEKGVE